MNREIWPAEKRKANCHNAAPNRQLLLEHGANDTARDDRPPQRFRPRIGWDVSLRRYQRPMPETTRPTQLQPRMPRYPIRHQAAQAQSSQSHPSYFPSPNGQRISGERGGEADERVRCMRVLGDRLIFAALREALLPASRACSAPTPERLARAAGWVAFRHSRLRRWTPECPAASSRPPARSASKVLRNNPTTTKSSSAVAFTTGRLTGSASAASEEPKAMSESAACGVARPLAPHLTKLLAQKP